MKHIILIAAISFAGQALAIDTPEPPTPEPPAPESRSEPSDRGGEKDCGDEHYRKMNKRACQVKPVQTITDQRVKGKL